MNVTLVSTGVMQEIDTITSVSTTATVTTEEAHGYSTSDLVTISGADSPEYNGTYTITVTSTTTFTYTLPAAISTSAQNAQFFPLPNGEVTVEGMYVTVGSVNYPLTPLASRYNWNQLNAIQIQASAIPQFYFLTPYGFGIWPRPQATYTGVVSYHYRDRNLSVADYTAGTVSLTRYSTLLTGSSTTFTPAMVGRWMEVTDTTVPGQGYWYKILDYVSTTVLVMDRAWPNASASGVSYRIGQSPEIPEDGHVIFAWGTTADYYGGMQKDTENFTKYDNMFWTGNPGITPAVARSQGTAVQVGGLIGLQNRYADRDDRSVVKRKPNLNPLQYKVFATTLSE